MSTSYGLTRQALPVQWSRVNRPNCFVVMGRGRVFAYLMPEKKYHSITGELNGRICAERKSGPGSASGMRAGVG
eukprot:2672083-Prymnesium_polylepis.2